MTFQQTSKGAQAKANAWAEKPGYTVEIKTLREVANESVIIVGWLQSLIDQHGDEGDWHVVYRTLPNGRAIVTVFPA